jgi:peptide/nickel transport system substrate-binding protein
VVFDGLYVPIAQAVPPNSPFYAPEVPPPGRDVAKARALLAEAGVRTPLVVELMVLNSPDARQTGEVIQSMAAEAGFDVRLRSQEIVSALRASDQGDYEAFMIGWSGRIDADGNLANMVTTNRPLNAGRYSNPDVDRLLQQAREVTDVAKRRALYGQVAVQLQKDLPSIYLYSGRWIFAAHRNVTGFKQVPDGLVRLQDLKFTPGR